MRFNLVYNGSGTFVISAPYAFTYTGNGLPNTVNVDGKNFSFIYDDGDKLINRNNPDMTQDIYTYNDAKSGYRRSNGESGYLVWRSHLDSNMVK